MLPFAWSLDHVGPIARDVGDVALLFSVMADEDLAAARDPAVPDGEATELERDERLDGLRFLLADEFLEDCVPIVADAMRDAAAALEGLGARRIEARLPTGIRYVAAAAVTIFLAEAGAFHRVSLRRWPEAYQAPTRRFLELADHVDAYTYVQAQRFRHGFAREMIGLHDSADILLAPVLPVPVPRVNAERVQTGRGEIDVRAAMTPFTRPFNLTGQPSLCLPCGLDDAGLPIGVQMVGRPFDEGTILRAGAAYERVTTAAD